MGEILTDAATLVEGFYRRGVGFGGLTAYTFALDAGPGDYLLEINPTTGRMIRVVGSVGKPQLWGTAYWAGVTYAFSNGGEVLQLNPANASPTRVAALDGGPDAKGFYGAGVTTSAPTK